jgi:hypothetical protein
MYLKPEQAKVSWDMRRKVLILCSHYEVINESLDYNISNLLDTIETYFDASVIICPDHLLLLDEDKEISLYYPKSNTLWSKM